MEKMRTFLALPIEKETKKEVFSYIEKFKKEIKGKVKWVEEENLHFTIFFFGEIDNDKVKMVIDVIEKNRNRFKKFMVEFKKISFFPNERNPRVIFLDISQGEKEMKEIYDTLYPDLNKILKLKKEEFVPHLTIGRVKDTLFEEDIKKLINEKVEIKPFYLNKITFFESILRSEGPIYKSIKDFIF
ncbi:MAG: RNA 2',3'-cyclic phosphodiesterase [Caldisericia bacterium]|jgi:2'-5' RNA ligase|nr:RNA 2',3'-cyclic phosphodiesterase [Caldisericia bacterium]